MKTIVTESKTISKLLTPTREFQEINKDAKKYMAMHWVGGSFLIYSALVPIFMNKLGVNIVTVGAIFSFAGLFDAVLTFLLSKKFDKFSPNIGIALDWVTESLPALIYGLASTNFHFLLAAISRRVTNVLNSVYRMYENEIFDENRRSLIYTYHLITPQFFTLLLYPLVGYLLTYKFTTVTAYRTIFWICGVGYLFLSIVPVKFLKWVEPVKITTGKKKKISFPKELYLCAFAQILVMIGISVVPTFVTSYYILEKLNGTVMDIMLLTAVEAIIIISTGLISKNLNKLISDAKIAQYGIMFFMVYALLMIFAKQYIIVLIASIFTAIGNTIWFPHHYSLLMKYIPKEKRGEFFGSIDSISKLLGILLPVLTGILIHYTGFYAPFGITLVCFGLCGLIYKKITVNAKVVT